jgi:hypothetical protein|tara:strand:- start:2592 stop:3092 length:501 start_codon:yes stop_codon:yes gene_type:complete
MAYTNYTPLFSEILLNLGKIKSKKDKVSYLRQNNSESLRQIIKSSFDPKIIWALPYGDVPYVQNEAPEGTEHTVLSFEVRKLYHFIVGGNASLPQNKREMMFVQMLEGLHKNEAAVLVAAKDKKLHQVYKGLSAPVVKEAFNWNDDYMINDENRVIYPQLPGPANG